MKTKTFKEAKASIEGLIRYDKDQGEIFGLDRIKELAKQMGNPQNSYLIIHIGGTAGKGSTATIAAAMLQEAGYKTGLHVSPTLEDIRERAQVNGKLMTEGEFVELTNAIMESGEKVQKLGHSAPTYFEVLVVMALQHFKDSGVDVAVVEVGLGGRVDGTNIVDSKVAVLTNVGLDHTEILGNTVEEIATDKVGIFKKGIEVVSGVTQPSVIKIVKDRANSMSCNLSLLGREIRYKLRKSVSGKTAFDLDIENERYDGLEMSVIGEHQIRNAALAIAAVKKMKKQGIDVSEAKIRGALKKVNIPGRFEIMGNSPTIIIDGAHNPMKANALLSTLKSNYPGKQVKFVFAAKRDKNIAEMLEILSPIASKFYFTRFQAITDFGSRMSYPPEEMQAITSVKSEVVEPSINAYERARSEAGRDEIICVTGSLYLVGELRSAILALKT